MPSRPLYFAALARPCTFTVSPTTGVHEAPALPAAAFAWSSSSPYRFDGPAPTGRDAPSVDVGGLRTRYSENRCTDKKHEVTTFT